MERRASIAEAVLASAELTEVAGGLGDNVVVEVEGDAALLVYCNRLVIADVRKATAKHWNVDCRVFLERRNAIIATAGFAPSQSEAPQDQLRNRGWRLQRGSQIKHRLMAIDV